MATKTQTQPNDMRVIDLARDLGTAMLAMVEPTVRRMVTRAVRDAITPRFAPSPAMANFIQAIGLRGGERLELVERSPSVRWLQARGADGETRTLARLCTTHFCGYKDGYSSLLEQDLADAREQLDTARSVLAERDADVRRLDILARETTALLAPMEQRALDAEAKCLELQESLAVLRGERNKARAQLAAERADHSATVNEWAVAAMTRVSRLECVIGLLERDFYRLIGSIKHSIRLESDDKICRGTALDLITTALKEAEGQL